MQTASRLKLTAPVIQTIDETDVVTRERAIAQLDEAIQDHPDNEAYRRGRNIIKRLPRGTTIDITR